MYTNRNSTITRVDDKCALTESSIPRRQMISYITYNTSETAND